MAKKLALRERRQFTAGKGLLRLRSEIRIDHESGDIGADDADHERRDQSGRCNQANPFIEVQLHEMQRVFMVGEYVAHGNLQPSWIDGMA